VSFSLGVSLPWKYEFIRPVRTAVPNVPWTLQIGKGPNLSRTSEEEKSCDQLFGEVRADSSAQKVAGQYSD
jgi:hypothetical protein